MSIRTSQPVTLPAHYFALLSAGLIPVEARLAAEPQIDLATLEAGPGGRHFPGALLAAATLYARAHPANPSHGDRRWRTLAETVGDLLTREDEAGRYATRLDHHRDTYMWLEAWGLLEKELDTERRARWRRALETQAAALAAAVAEREDYPRYQAPFLYTSPNHYALWASTLHLAGLLFAREDWEALGARVMHRFVTQEQAPDGYWGEHDDTPTTGYNNLTVAAAALYAERREDPAAIEALRRATTFHTHFTYPDGAPVETINDRNRHWEINAWGHFGFSRFPEGRRYAAFLSGFFREGEVGYEALGRCAQNALYYHEGPSAPIPQETAESAHALRLPAGIRRSAPWTVCLSGLISPPPRTNRFFLDRQSALSLFHDRIGLIVTGAGSKRQPELATFSQTIQGVSSHLPLHSRLRMDETRDRLGLAYDNFVAELEVERPTPTGVAFRFHLSERGQVEEAWLTLQLCLKSGEALETAAGRITLGAERIELGPAELGGWIRHGGWTLRTDPEARLSWPVFPFNPYADGPETALTRAVGALRVPVDLRQGAASFPTQTIAFRLEASGEAGSG